MVKTAGRAVDSLVLSICRDGRCPCAMQDVHFAPAVSSKWSPRRLEGLNISFLKSGLASATTRSRGKCGRHGLGRERGLDRILARYGRQTGLFTQRKGTGVQTYSMLGVEVDALDMPALNGVVSSAIQRNKQIVISYHNLHSAYLCRRDASMREFYAACDVAFIDGMPLIFWGRALGHPLRRDHRITYVDWIRPLASQCARQAWRFFYLGSRPGVAEEGARRLRRELPGLHITTRHGYFDASGRENNEVLEAIAQADPHILMVGMGMPRQERWVLENRARLPANAIVTSGAAMDYVAGAVATPPRWSGPLGLEWAFRLLHEPRRLSGRYLLEPWTLLPRAWADVRRTQKQ